MDKIIVAESLNKFLEIHINSYVPYRQAHG